MSPRQPTDRRKEKAGRSYHRWTEDEKKELLAHRHKHPEMSIAEFTRVYPALFLPSTSTLSEAYILISSTEILQNQRLEERLSTYWQDNYCKSRSWGFDSNPFSNHEQQKMSNNAPKEQQGTRMSVSHNVNAKLSSLRV